jgi:hypothetical protein
VNPNMINSIECEIIVEQSRQPERLLGASQALALQEPVLRQNWQLVQHSFEV